jgi:hypothetical protein
MGPSPLEEPFGWEFQGLIMVAAYLVEVEVEVEVGGNAIFLGVIHQAVKLGSRLVQVLEAVA